MAVGAVVVQVLLEQQELLLQVEMVEQELYQALVAAV